MYSNKIILYLAFNFFYAILRLMKKLFLLLIPVLIMARSPFETPKEYNLDLSKFDTIQFLDEPKGFFSNRWITCIKTNSYQLREEIRLALQQDDIESRPLWKPMHMQPIFKNNLSYTDGTSENLFDKGLCLPSGSNLTQDDLDRVLNIIAKTSNS